MFHRIGIGSGFIDRVDLLLEVDVDYMDFVHKNFHATARPK